MQSTNCLSTLGSHPSMTLSSSYRPLDVGAWTKCGPAGGVKLGELDPKILTGHLVASKAVFRKFGADGVLDLEEVGML